MIFRPRIHYKAIAVSVGVTALSLWAIIAGAVSSAGISTLSDPPSHDADLSAICPIVYPLDQFPTAQGSRYFFYGNAFFINEEGYLITAAHVVGAFSGGGRPYILVGPAGGLRHLQEAVVVAEDQKHDVAILRAVRNPFKADYKVTYLPLAAQTPTLAQPVLAVGLHPLSQKESFTSETWLEKYSSGNVLEYLFTRADTGSDTELMLLSQRVVAGDSGSPVLSAESHEAVGIVVGQWLGRQVAPLVASPKPESQEPGAALRIHYAIALLQERGITWHSGSSASDAGGAARIVKVATVQNVAQQPQEFTPPAPLSVVATPYPPQALFGGEVTLDALIDASGKIADLHVVHGEAPFLQAVLEAVHTWSFLPARLDGRAVDARQSIIFQFPQSFIPPLTSKIRKYQEPAANTGDHGPLPVSTIEPEYPANSIAEGSVVLYDVVNDAGNIASTDVLHDVASLTALSVAATSQWKLVPAKQTGTNTESAMVVVFTFRRAAVRAQ